MYGIMYGSISAAYLKLVSCMILKAVITASFPNPNMNYYLQFAFQVLIINAMLKTPSPYLNATDTFTELGTKRAEEIFLGGANEFLMECKTTLLWTELQQ